MAATLVDGRVAQRQDSIRSVESDASSVTSAVSLSRRPRIRVRSRTVTGTPAPLNESSAAEQAPDLPFLDKSYVREPLELVSGSPPVPQVDISTSLPGPTMDGPTANPQAENGRDGHADLSLLGQASGLSNLRNPSSTTVKSSKTSGLQVLPTAAQPNPPPSAFSRHPELTQIDASTPRARDSMFTQFSGTSSSVYPISSTTSEPETPLSPQSLHHNDPSLETHSFEPEIVEPPGFDADDVSYRLQLLVKNSYFLPPAHTKPSLAELAASNPNANRKPSRSGTPNFLDIFRGKNKTKPSTPTAPIQQKPTLRTTSDSINTGRDVKPRLSSQASRTQPNPALRTGRVVVVREKMEDLVLAAKQAEKEMKTKTQRRDQDTPRETKPNDVIDPTDAVDVPLPSSTYPFAVQASAMRGLGVQDSVGAALLADRLPPRSPDLSTSNAVHDWRTALLHQAVHHSLDNLNTSVDLSFSNAGASSTPLASPKAVSSLRVSSPTSPSPPTSPASKSPTPVSPTPIFAQPIIADFRVSDASQPPSLKSKKSSASMVSARVDDPNNSGLNSLRQSILPIRAETPQEPLTPLTPLPRKFLVNTVPPTPTSPRVQGHESAQNESQRQLEHPPSSPLQKDTSLPGLPDSYDHQRDSLQPPSFSITNSSMGSLSSRHLHSSASFEDMHDAKSHMTGSRASFDESHQGNSNGRISMTLSAFDGAASRVSLSEYSQNSPTSSAFQSAPLASDSADRLQAMPDPEHTFTSYDHSHPRHSTTSPPPRVSSSFGFAPLSPAPRRPANQANKSVKPQASGSTFSDHVRRGTPLTDDTTLLIMAPEPSSPPLPPRAPLPLSLEIPGTDIVSGLHSPVPASPTSFFDTIQSQPNAMDELESSSSESEDDDDYAQPLPPPFHPYSDPRARTMSTVSGPATFYGPGRLSNGSHSNLQGRSSSPTSISSKQAVGNIPVRAPFFTERAGRSDSGHAPPTSPLDFYKFSQPNRPGSADPHLGTSETAARRRSTVSATAAWPPREKDETLKKFDGMLKQHMQAEKDRIKKIAHSARSNASVHSQGN